MILASILVLSIRKILPINFTYDYVCCNSIQLVKRIHIIIKSSHKVFFRYVLCNFLGSGRSQETTTCPAQVRKTSFCCNDEREQLNAWLSSKISRYLPINNSLIRLIFLLYFQVAQSTPQQVLLPVREISYLS